MNEDREENHVNLCDECLRKVVKAQYSIELNTHTLCADWKWRIRLGIMGVCLGFVRWLTSIDPRFYLVTLERGAPTWQKPKENAKLEVIE